MNIAYLLLGGNEGDRVALMAAGRKLLEEHAGKISAVSALYETAAWGKTDQPNFLNQVIAINTKLSAAALLAQTQKTENELGRQRTEVWGQRTLDIDILYFNDSIIETEQLQIPHPQLHLRKFTLVPLCDIAPGLIHPKLKKNTLELLQHCEDKLEVRLFDSEKI